MGGLLWEELLALTNNLVRACLAVEVNVGDVI